MALVLLTTFSRLGLGNAPPPISPGMVPGFNTDCHDCPCSLVVGNGFGVFLYHMAQQKASRQQSTSLDAKYLFHVFLDRQNCDALVGDLEERYSLIRKEFGQRRAALVFLDSDHSICGTHDVDGDKKLSVLAMLLELYRRIRS